MGKYIYINYAYEDQQQVMAIIRRMQGAGLQVCYGNISEEKVAGSICIIHFCTEASRTSKSYRKMMNYALKHEIDSMLFHLEKGSLVSDVDVQLDAVYALFKYKYQTAGIDCEMQPVTEDQTEKQENLTDMPLKKEQKEADEDQAETAKTKLEESAEPTKEEYFAIGKRWLTGEGCDVDEKKAFECFRQAANQGHIEAQYQLSICYDRGQGVRRSITEAAKWCQMAAYGGHAQAQSEIGYCYEYGQGVVRNIKEAVRWYEIASEQGNIEAKNNLAFCYQKGKGGPKRVADAIRLYQEAAEAGHASAQYNLGFCYWYGEGIETDKAKAIELFRQSAANGNAKAGQMLKILNQHAYLRK